MVFLLPRDSDFGRQFACSYLPEYEKRSQGSIRGDSKKFAFQKAAEYIQAFGISAEFIGAEDGETRFKEVRPFPSLCWPSPMLTSERVLRCLWRNNLGCHVNLVCRTIANIQLVQEYGRTEQAESGGKNALVYVQES